MNDQSSATEALQEPRTLHLRSRAADDLEGGLLEAGPASAPALEQRGIEAERLRLQTGHAKVCAFATVASIRLHPRETLEGDRQASTELRVGVFHQACFSGIAGRQVTGRNHRDQQVRAWHIAYAQDAVEERVRKVMVDRIGAASDTVGGYTAGLTDVAEPLGADRLPSGALTAGGA